MKKAIFENYGDASMLKIVEGEVPTPSKNEVLVKVEAAGLNPKDILIRKGKFKRLSGRRLPQMIGYDFAGVIEDANGSSFQQQDKVFGMVNGWDGKCCAEYLTVNTNELYQMPDRISFEDAAGVPLAAQTALQSIRDLGKLQPGQNICINGASGGVGTLAIQIAKDLGGVVTSISSGVNLDLCKSLGADVTLDYTQTNILESKQKFDVFYDVFGNYSFKKTSPILTKRGIYISTVPKADIFIEQLKNPFRSQKAKIVIVKSKSSDLKYLADKISQNRIQPVTDRIFPLELIQDAQKYIETKRAKGKVIVKISK